MYGNIPIMNPVYSILWPSLVSLGIIGVGVGSGLVAVFPDVLAVAL